MDHAGHKGKVRVAHIITKLELGGAQKNTLYTVSHLSAADFEPILITGTRGPLVSAARSLQGVETYFLPSLRRRIRPHRDAQAFSALLRLLRRLRPDIVHTHSSKAGILGRWAAFASGVPIIIHTIHGFPFHAHQRLLPRLFFLGVEKVTVPITTHLIAVSRANREEGIRRQIFPPEKISLIRSGIPLADFSDTQSNGSAIRKRLGLHPSKMVVGMVGCLKPQKAPLDFLALAQRVLAQRSDAQFVLVGDGVLRRELEKQIQAEGLSSDFHLVGWEMDMPAALSVFDMLVLTSLWEGLPRVIPEAMAAGQPVIATAVDGTPEAVIHGKTGYLVEPHQIEQMAVYVNELLDRPDQRRAFGREGKKRVEEFCIDAMVQQQETLYLSCLHRHGIMPSQPAKLPARR